MANKSWRAQIYKPKPKDRFYLSVTWKKLRREILYRDGYRCLRCDKRFTADRLSVHHLKPKLEGGPDSPENLVTLCKECHDLVEIQKLRTHAAIMGSAEQKTSKVEVRPLEFDPNRPRWHAYVYGGQRNPNL